MLSVYIVDSFDDYECLREGSCSPGNWRDFNVSSGVQESLNETFSISSYYFIVLASDDDIIQESYTYEATSQFYNYSDHTYTMSSCDVTQEKECTLAIGNFDECALAYTSAVISGVDFIPLKSSCSPSVIQHHIDSIPCTVCCFTNFGHNQLADCFYRDLFQTSKYEVWL